MTEVEKKYLQRQIDTLLYGLKHSEEEDEHNFVIPQIMMNDGRTFAQVRYESNGIYKDVQRSPFKRVTGTFTEDGTIPDVDITALVYYGTLEQSRIAPTLENIEVKLYIREPNLKKIPASSEEGIYADTYVWREIPAGFHVYNNDTLYGFEWLVYQDDYSKTDGVYTLHMNTEDGLGACKFAGSQSPITLKGVQYKLIVTAKNLWNREYSLMDSMPLIKSLETNTDDLAPSVNAVKNYYKKALETAKVVTGLLNAGNDQLVVTEDGTKIKDLTVHSLDVVGKKIIYQEDLDEHVKETVDNPAKDIDGNIVGLHGIKNTGFSGNLQAHSLDGAVLSNGAKAIEEDVSEKAYIPFVDEDNSIGMGTVIKTFTKKDSKGVGTPVTVIKLNPSGKTLHKSESVSVEGVTDFVYTLVTGNTVLNATITGGNSPSIELKGGNLYDQDVTLTLGNLDSKKVNTQEVKVGTVLLNATILQNTVLGSSTIAYKYPISEFLGIKVKEALGSELAPNSPTDADGNKVGVLDTSIYEGQNLLVGKNTKEAPTEEEIRSGISGLDKLGSALQALHELPLSVYTYKRGQSEYKEQLGIFIERVNQIRDNLKKLQGTDSLTGNNPSEDNYLVYKKSQQIQSNLEKVVLKDEGLGVESNTEYGTFTERKNNNAYTYTEEEIKSIAHYLDLTTSKKELTQEIRNTVGILLKAAKETQDRLLDVETNIYGWDSPTLPGNGNARKEFINSKIAKSLQSSLNNSPLLLGLNRLMRTICLELFDTTDVERIEAEMVSRVTDTEESSNKPTVKSRMDQVDEVLSIIYNRLSALTQYYIENITNDEGVHTYTDIIDFENNQVKIAKSDKGTNIEGQAEADLLGNLDNNTPSKDFDKGNTWKNLPNTEDIEAIPSVKFAEVYSKAHLHTPDPEESGVVRIPETVPENTINDYKTSHTDVNEQSHSQDRSWDALKVDKEKGEEDTYWDLTGTYKPVFTSKAVAWDSAKVERMNKKLTEVVKTVYGTDDVTASLPNRTEVFRRNINNLVDDLYPNRFFDTEQHVEVSDETADIVKPFKGSRETRLGPSTLGPSKFQKKTDEGNIKDHTSILTWLDNEIFNFSIENHFIINKGPTDIEETGIFADGLDSSKRDFRSNKQITTDAAKHIINFSTANLVTDPLIGEKAPNEDYGTYFQAYSRIDLLESVLGIEDCFVSDLWSSGIEKTNGGFSETEYDFPVSTGDSTKRVEELAKEKEDLTESHAQTQSTVVSLQNDIKNLETELVNLSTLIDKNVASQANQNTLIESKKSLRENQKAKLQKCVEDLATFQAEKDEWENKPEWDEKEEKELRIKYLKEEQESLSTQITALQEKLATLDSNWHALENLKSNIDTLSEWQTSMGNWFDCLTADPDTTLKNPKNDDTTLNQEITLVSTGEIWKLNKGKLQETYTVYFNKIWKNTISREVTLLDKNGEVIATIDPGETYYSDDTSCTISWKPERNQYYISTLGTYFDDLNDSSFNSEDYYMENGNKIEIEYQLEIAHIDVIRKGSLSLSITQNGNTTQKEFSVTGIIKRVEKRLSNVVNTANVNYKLNYNGINRDNLNYNYNNTGLRNKMEEVNSKLSTAVQSETSAIPTYEELLYTDGVKTKDDGTPLTLNDLKATDQSGLDNLLATLETTESELSETTTQLNDLKNTLQSYQTKIDALDIEIIPLQAQVKNLQESVTEMQSKLEDLENELAQLKTDLTELQESQEQAQAEKLALGTTLGINISLEQSQSERLNTIESLLDFYEKSQININEKLQFYLKELNFRSNLTKKTEVETLTKDLLTSSNIGYILTRKEKKIQARISTLEAFSDLISKTAKYDRELRSDANAQNTTTWETKPDDANERFEATTLQDSLKRLFKLNENRQEFHRLFDLDLSMSAEGAELHNRKVWQVVPLSTNLSKTRYNAKTRSYNITGNLVSEKECFPIQDPLYLNSFVKGLNTQWSLTVKYVDELPSTLDVRTIYLKRRTPTTDYKNFYNAGNSDDVKQYLTEKGSVTGWQNETEYNVYKTINNLFNSLLNSGDTTRGGVNIENNANNLYYQMMLLAHPVGSVYMSFNETDPSKLFGGTWERITDRFLLGVGSIQVSPGQIGGNQAISLRVDNLPAHQHSYPVHKFVMGDFYLRGGLTQVVTSISDYPATTGRVGNGTKFDIMPPYTSVYMWKRTS